MFGIYDTSGNSTDMKTFISQEDAWDYIDNKYGTNDLTWAVMSVEHRNLMYIGGWKFLKINLTK